MHSCRLRHYIRSANRCLIVSNKRHDAVGNFSSPRHHVVYPGPTAGLVRGQARVNVADPVQNPAGDMADIGITSIQ